MSAADGMPLPRRRLSVVVRRAAGGRRGRNRLIAGLVFGPVAAVALGAWSLGYHYENISASSATSRIRDFAVSGADVRALARIHAQGPRGVYVVIDRANNRLWLRRGSDILLKSVVSTGSGAVLKETTGQRRTWLFETPAGHFRIREIRYRPTWTRPDWSFLEEGQPIPGRLEARFQPDALGEYALDIGDEYMIHGTLYERLLGHSVTHGCVRVGRDDLRTIVARVRPGTSVYIY